MKEREWGVGSREWGYSFESIAPYPRAQIANNNPSPQSPSHPTPFLFLLLLTLLALSCATSPKTGIERADGTPDFAVLPPGAELYLWADAVRGGAVLEALSSIIEVNGSDASQILERTTTALAAFYPENASRQFFLAGYGDYPNLRAGFSMSFSRDWSKRKSETGNRYWYSKSNNLGIALGPHLAFPSDGDPFSPGQNSNPAPSGFEEFRLPSVLAGWLGNPGPALDRLITKLGVPVQIPAEELFIAVARSPAAKTGQDKTGTQAPWELVFKIKTPSASQARSLVSLFSMARVFIRQGAVPAGTAGSLSMSPQEAAALLFANAPVQDAEWLTLRSGSLDENRIAALFSMLVKQEKR